MIVVQCAFSYADAMQRLAFAGTDERCQSVVFCSADDAHTHSYDKQHWADRLSDTKRAMRLVLRRIISFEATKAPTSRLSGRQINSVSDTHSDHS